MKYPSHSFTMLAVIAILACLALHFPDGQADEPRLDRAAMASELESHLRENFVPAWYPRVVDPLHGGFMSEFDADWQPGDDQRKMVVTQARHVWTAARLSEFLDDPVLARLALKGSEFLLEHVRDAEHGGFFWLVNRDGSAIANADGNYITQAYGQAFAIYALAALHEVTGNETALTAAIEAFRWLDRSAHDAEHGGYFNYISREGKPLREGYVEPPGDFRIPPKDQNSSIHILEAFTELYRVWPDELLALRLREMLELIRDRLVVPPGRLIMFFEADWAPYSLAGKDRKVVEDLLYYDHVSFGHDVETAYLLEEAEHALSGHVSERTLAVGKQLVDHSLAAGWDAEQGGFIHAGFYFSGEKNLTRMKEEKDWWAQAEGLNTLLIMADRYPDDERDYAARLMEQWRYIDRWLIDHERGGWYSIGLDRRPDMTNASKAGIWKGAYHDGRALINVIRRLRASDHADSVKIR